MAGFLRLEDAQSEITRRLEDYGRQLFQGGPPDPQQEQDDVVQRLTRGGLQLIEAAKPFAPPQLNVLTRAPEAVRSVHQAAQTVQSWSQPQPATPSQSEFSGPAVGRGGDLHAYARQAAQRAGIDPDIFERQIQQESGFQTRATSSVGAQGIAQIVPKYHPGVDTSDPYASLDYASNLMKSHLAKYGGDYSRALAAYNAGPGAVDRYGGIPPFEETQRYVSTILGGAKRQVQQAVEPFVQGARVVGAALQPGEEPPTQPPPQPSVDKWRTSFDFGSTYTGAYRTGTPHRGIDLVPHKGGIGTPVEAFHPGTVTLMQRDRGAGGLMVYVRDDQGLTHAYMHLQGTAPGLQVGQRVERGQQIATMGESGTEGSPHLHYEVRRNAATGDPLNQLIDPRPYMTGQHGPESVTAAATGPVRMGQMQPGPPDTKTITRPLEDLGAGAQQLVQQGMEYVQAARQQLTSPQTQGMVQRMQPGGVPMTPERAREVRTGLEQAPGVQGGMGLIEAFRQSPAANVLGTAARTVLTPQGPLEALGVTPQQARGMILGPAAISDEDLLATARTDEIESARGNFRTLWGREPNQAQTLEMIRGLRTGMAYAGERGQPPVGRTPEGQITMGAGTTGISQTPSFLRESLRRMYPGAINKAAVKEAVQNSVDASRGIPGATTYVNVDNSSKTVSIVDQGKGMSPQTMEAVFVRLGGSDKPAGASGGMGTAIKAVMANGEETWVRSIGRDPATGQLTDSVMHGSSDDFLGGTMHRYYARYGEMPDSELAGAPPEIANWEAQHPNTTGTALWTKPMADASWAPYTLLSWVNSFNHLNRVGDQRVQFTVDGQMLDPSKKYSQWVEDQPPVSTAVNPDDLPSELIQTIHTPGAEIDLYGSRNVTESDGKIVHLLNQGQYQADMHVYLDGNAKLPTTLSADIRPTVGARDVGYPWTADRNALVDVDAQGLKDFVRNDLAVAAVAKENKRVADSIDQAPLIRGSGGQRLVDDAEVFPRLTPEHLERLTQSPAYARLARAAESLHNALNQELYGREVMGVTVGDSHPIGLAISEKWHGLNLPPSFTPWAGSGDTAKGILINPWTIWHEIESNFGGAPRSEQLERFNELLMGVMTHEIAHNTSVRGHSEGFAGILTRLPTYLGTSMRRAVTTELQRALTPVWDTLADELSSDAQAFRAYGRQSGIAKFGEESPVARGAGPDVLAGDVAGGGAGGPPGGGAPDYRGRGGPGYPPGDASQLGPRGEARAAFAAGLGGAVAGGAGLLSAAQQGFLSPVTERLEGLPERAGEVAQGALGTLRGAIDPGMLQRMVQGGSATPEETRANLEAINELRREAFPSILDPNHPSVVIPEMQAKYPGRIPGSVDESAMTPEDRERYSNARQAVGGMTLSGAGGHGIGRVSRALFGRGVPRPPGELPTPRGMAVPEPGYTAGTPEAAAEDMLRRSAQANQGRARLSQQEIQSLPGMAGSRLSDLDEVREAVQTGMPGSRWYSDVVDQIRQDTGQSINPREAAVLMGATGGNAGVPGNYHAMLSLFRAVRKANPDLTGFESMDTAAIQNTQAFKDVYKWVAEQKAYVKPEMVARILRGYRTGEVPIPSGAKVSSYTQNFLHALSDSYDPYSTQDVWQGRLFGARLKPDPLNPKKLVQDTATPDVGASDQAYRSMHALTNWVARELDIPPREAQAAGWAVIRTLWNDATIGPGLQTGAKSLRQALAEGMRSGLLAPARMAQTLTEVVGPSTGKPTAWIDKMNAVRNLIRSEGLFDKPAPPSATALEDIALRFPAVTSEAASMRAGDIPRPVGSAEAAELGGLARAAAPVLRVPGRVQVDQAGRIPGVDVEHTVQSIGDDDFVRLVGVGDDTAHAVGSRVNADQFVIGDPDVRSLAGVAIDEPDAAARAALARGLRDNGVPVFETGTARLTVPLHATSAVQLRNIVATIKAGIQSYGTAQTATTRLLGRRVDVRGARGVPGGAGLPPSAAGRPVLPAAGGVPEGALGAVEPPPPGGFTAPAAGPSRAPLGREPGYGAVPFATQLAGPLAGAYAGYQTSPEEAGLGERALRTTLGAVAGRGAERVVTAPFRGGLDQTILQSLRRGGLQTGPGRPQPVGIIGTASDLSKQGLLTNPMTHVGNMVGNTIELFRTPAALAMGGKFDEAGVSLAATMKAMPEAFRVARDVLMKGDVAATLGTEAEKLGARRPVYRALSAMDLFTRTMAEYQGMAAKGTELLNKAGIQPGTQQAANFLAQHADELYEAGARSGMTSVFGAEKVKRGGMPILDDFMSKVTQWKEGMLASPDWRRQAMGAILDSQIPFMGVPTRLLGIGVARLPGISQASAVARAAVAFKRGDTLAAHKAMGEGLLETIIQMKIADAISSGAITGIDDPEHPSSINIGGTWVPLRQFGGYTLPMQIMASFADGYKRSGNKVDQDQADRFAAGLNAAGKTFWKAVPGHEFVDMLSKVGQGQGIASGVNVAQDVITRYTAPTFIKNIEDSLDPVARDIAREGPEQLWEPTMARWPALAQYLPERIDPATGQPMPRQRPQGPMGALAGLVHGEGAPPNLLRKEVHALRGEGYTDLSEMRGYTDKVTIAGSEIRLTEDEQRAVARITGRALADMSRTLSGAAYQNATPAEKAAQIEIMQEVASDLRANAVMQVIPTRELEQRIRGGRRVVGRLQEAGVP